MLLKKKKKKFRSSQHLITMVEASTTIRCCQTLKILRSHHASLASSVSRLFSVQNFFIPTMTTNTNPPLKIYCENIISIIFLFLTQYKFKIFFFLFPPFTCHSTAIHHIWIRTSTLPFIYFPKASISQGLIYTTP